MRFSERWLREFVDPPHSLDELARILTMAGIEVEAIEPVAPAFDQVVVGQVLEVARHPNADRLSLCRVDVGGGAPLAIVCGAPNVAKGMKAPTALVGARLPGIEIRQAQVRGVESQGMLCSAKELGLSDDHSGLLALADNARVGADVRAVLDLDDRLMTLKLTPNRGDCLSVRGLARELSILADAALKLPKVAPVKAAIPDRRAVRLEAPDACPRYAGRVIRGVNARARTPAWMARRIERSGLRAISPLVDVTNFVMLELGQPLHAFDDRTLEGGIVVRFARAGERLRLLNGQDVELQPDLLVIADEKKPVALGGVMGGEATAVTEATTDVFLESAFFSPAAVAGRARRLALASDAAFRFERGVDFAGSVEALERATQLVVEICGGTPGPIGEALERLPERLPVRLRTARAAKIVGVPFTDAQIDALLARLRLRYSGGRGEFTVTPPSYRFDLEIEEDLVEEVARLHGYDNIPSRPPAAPLVMLGDPEARRGVPELKRILAGREYFEVINYSFVDSAWERDFCANADPVALANPIAAQLDVMRSSLAGGLVANLRFNLARKLERVRIFEAGRCFLRSDAADDPRDPARAVPGFRQPMRVGGLAYGLAIAEQWGAPKRRVDFYDVKADVEALLAPRTAAFVKTEHPALHPGRAAAVTLEGEEIGWIGELHPRWQQKYDLPQAPVLFELDAGALLAVGMPAYRQVSKFPPVIRDRAVEVGENVPAEALLAEMNRSRPPVVQEIRLFDFYRGPGLENGKKSLAFRVVMQDTARTLTDEEADAAMAQLTDLLSAKFGARLRT
ncbi:MAG TPA: phenylalanine--tRNA ligase subunit beta [Burkholderiales bacterium]|nr:phenylalanine--tRNA ligase subunit beta [Burkholderiales bacterium]